MPKYNVLIVDDSAFMRKVFSDVIAADADFKVLATASNGKEGVELALKLKPDIITMDLEMPDMNGIEALRLIMAVQPTPVIMLSAVTDNGTRDTIRALQYGALDFIHKTDGALKKGIHQVGEQLLDKLHIALETVRSGAFRMLPAVEEETASYSETETASPPDAEPKRDSQPNCTSGNNLTHDPPVQPAPKIDMPVMLPSSILPLPEQQTKATPQPQERPSPDQPEIKKRIVPLSKAADEIASMSKESRTKLKPSALFTHLVAIGASTGGPRALHEVLTALPADFPAPVLVVQHMPPKFTFSLAQRLDTFCSIQVREAVHGELLETATAYIAPGGRHMTVAKQPDGTFRIMLSDEAPKSGHKPSVDVLFESLLGERHLKRHAVLMTGMGSDGAKGMKALQTDGAATTIAEAEHTCVVYGMPRSAVQLGAVSHLLPLQGIAPALVQEVSVHKL
jgi:two-component system, chemotaxis family, protein-glutamate methylesterase/glutaminase